MVDEFHRREMSERMTQLQGDVAMSKVIVDITMSLDGFVTGPNDGPGNGLGDGGRVLHDWVFARRTDADTQFLLEPAEAIGAMILGRRTFDIANEAWGENPPMVGPVFVLTHRPHARLTRGPATFTFATGGAQQALSQARAAAGEKGVVLMGANVSQQYLRAGLVDELQIHIANVLMGAGRPLFADIGEQPIMLERLLCTPTPAATHMRFRVIA
jgi:dihydrofolate reductase